MTALQVIVVLLGVFCLVSVIVSKIVTRHKK